jgi:hypothetical protein
MLVQCACTAGSGMNVNEPSDDRDQPEKAPVAVFSLAHSPCHGCSELSILFLCANGTWPLVLADYVLV